MPSPFGSESWLYIIIIGLLVGIVARIITPGRRSLGIIVTIILGIIGAVVATFLGQQFGWYGPGQAAGFIGAVLGSILILGIIQLFRGGR